MLVLLLSAALAAIPTDSAVPVEEPDVLDAIEDLARGGHQRIVLATQGYRALETAQWLKQEQREVILVLSQVPRDQRGAVVEVMLEQDLECALWLQSKGTKLTVQSVGECRFSADGGEAADGAEADEHAEDEEPYASQVETAPVTFARLIVRENDGRVLGQAPEDYRIEFLETMREWGFDARGAEDLVFGRDESESARFALGGEVEQIEVEVGRKIEVEVTTDWRLLDRARDEVVYTVTTRGYRWDSRWSDQAPLVDGALMDSFESLLRRKTFVDLLAAPTDDDVALVPADWEQALDIERCTARDLALPADMEQALDAAVVIDTPQGRGSGVLVSADGFVWTAAHVVPLDAEVTVSLRNGLELPATPIRRDEFHDVAVLHLAGSGHPCLPVSTETPGVGTELFAVGSPLGEGLEFSVSKGVVSGLRAFDDWAYLQTDTSLNPGNSGGPLMGTDGAVTGLVSFKISAPDIEGLGFGVPSSVITERLGIRFTEASSDDPEALHGSVEASSTGDGPIVDEPDVSQMGKVYKLPSWARAQEESDEEKTYRVAEMKPIEEADSGPGPLFQGDLEPREQAGVVMVVGGGVAAIVGTAVYLSSEPEDPARLPGLVAGSAGLSAATLGAIMLTAPPPGVTLRF